MGIILLTILSSLVLGSVTWLALGDRFPLNEEDKWPAINNITVYVAGLLIPIYLVIFVVFSIFED